MPFGFSYSGDGFAHKYRTTVLLYYRTISIVSTAFTENIKKIGRKLEEFFFNAMKMTFWGYSSIGLHSFWTTSSAPPIQPEVLLL